MRLSEFYNKVSRFDMDEALSDMMIELSQEASDFVREQMREGKKKTGQPILPEYTPMTKWIKQQKGQEWRFVTLQDTNSFQSKIFLKIKGREFDFDSDDWKTSMLTDKYGREIFGMTEESKVAFMREFGREVLIKIIAQQTGIPTR